ncbi:MAG: UDP-glucose 4-epimerase GalE, partial [Lachnospiraceae bacterium]|nr:UDP-glucose 4-epimerase GalE [Lachnospiraceae bacterium]
MKVLVTGGAGFIGSHTCLVLLENGAEVVVVDNLVNSSKESLERVKKITGKDLKFYEVDMLSEKELDDIFEKENVDSVIHFAGLKAVGESCQIPLRYFDNNLKSTLNLLNSMKKHNVHNIVFSSSATVYGKPDSVPIREDFPLSVSNPYGRTKLIIEDMLRDIYKADDTLNIALLRYFNPIGAHESGLIGEDPNGIPNNLVPYVAKVAAGKLECINVFGDDYDTPDGTGVRDYIHVMDLAEAHFAALKKLEENPGLVTYNLGTGIGYSVLDIIHAFEKACGKELPYKITARRPGDIDECYA